MRAVLFLLTVVAFGQSGFDILSLNRAVDPCGNFYQFACGGWQKANPIPGDVARWGRFDALQNRNRTLLQNVLESASAERPGRTAIEQKIGDFYAACMNEEVQNRRSMDTFQRDVNRIAVVDNKAALTDLLVTMYKIGAPAFFNFSSEQDAKDSAHMIAGLDQGGLGLPDRDYYFKTDAKSVEIRTEYLAHLQRIFALLGQDAPTAQRNAAAVMAVETALAQGSLDRVSRRDPEKVYHKLTVEELKALAPNFDWTAFFAGLGAPEFKSLNVAVPEFVQAFGKMLNDQPLDNIKGYLTWMLVANNTTVLNAAI
jgi:predicted metalloendopeptidase